jgi:hypothetical protein
MPRQSCYIKICMQTKTMGVKLNSRQKKGMNIKKITIYFSQAIPTSLSRARCSNSLHKKTYFCLHLMNKNFSERKQANLSQHKSIIITFLGDLSWLRQTSTVYLASLSSWKPSASTNIFI